MRMYIPIGQNMTRFEPMIRTAIIVLTLLFPATNETYADATTTITSSGLNTVVTPPTPGGTAYSITNGTHVGNNLFHSLGEFSVGPLDTARFQTTNLVPDASISNILGRVTGGNPSFLFGTIDSGAYYPSANLFLLNPAGIIFGPNATLNVGRSVNFTTADYLRLADEVRFNATPHATADTLLSAAPVASFGFLSLAPGATRGAISVQGSSLSVSTGESITFVGGDVTIGNGAGSTQTASLSAPNGKIRLASAHSAGEFLHEPLQAVANASGQLFNTYGSIILAPGSLIDVSHGNSGTVSIRGGEFVLNVTNSVLRTSAPLPTIPTLDSIFLGGGSLLHSSTTSGANGAAIDIVTDTLDLKEASQMVSSNEGLGGLGGDIHITATKSVTVSGHDQTAVSGIRTDLGIVTSGVFAGTISDGTGGAVTIATPKLTIEDSAEVATLASGSGNSQTMTLDVGALEIKTGGRVSTISGWNYLLGDFSDGTGQAGMIRILGANSISIAGTGPFSNYSRIHGAAYGFAGNGPITIDTPSAAVALDDGGRVETVTGLGAEPSGDITLTIRDLNITNGSINSIGGAGRSGNILIHATDTVSLSGEVMGQPSPIMSENGGSGGTGIIRIETGILKLSNQARIFNSTLSDGTPSTDNKISIVATGSVIMTDNSDIRVLNFLSDVGGIALSSPVVTLSGQASMNTVGSGSGNSGPITINTQNFSLSEGGRLNSSILSGSTGQGGSITIQGLTSSTESILIDGTDSGLFSNTRGAGTGGNITVDTNILTIRNGGTISALTSGTAFSATGGNISLTADQSITIKDGASVSSSSDGPGNAGNIKIDAGKQLDLSGKSSITTEAKQASGGNIDLQATDRIRFVDSTLSASVSDGPGGGGNISIDPKLVLLQNSTVLAKADQGTGGRIAIRADSFLADANSIVNADAGRGINGTVTIQSPTSNLSGTVGQLVSKTSPPQVLLQNRCVALAGGEQSTFLLAGRETLPGEPSGWLSSPVSMEHWTGEEAAHASRLMVRNRELHASPVMTAQTSRPPVLSLRRLTPPGFLVRTFAAGATGCPS